MGKGQKGAGGGWGHGQAGGGWGHGRGQGQGQWLFVPQGYGVQQHMLKQFQQPAKAHGKGQGGQNSNDSPKMRLSQVLPLLLGRSATKADCVYEMEEVDGKHKAVLQIAALDRDRTDFIGAPATSKKEAEQNAARQALNLMAKEIKEIEKAHGKVTKVTKGHTAQTAGQHDQNANNSPKTRLSQVLPLLLGRAATKDDCIYEMNEEDGKYNAVLQIAALDRERNDFMGEPADNKKEAEQNAALQALNVMAKDIKEVEKARGKVTKRKHVETVCQHDKNANDSAKTRLSQVLPLLLGRAATKDDCVYEMNEEDGNYSAVLSIAALGSAATDFTGKFADNPKQAEQNAALRVLNVMAKEIHEAVRAHEEVKKAKKAESAAANIERIEAKKAAAAAAEAAAPC